MSEANILMTIKLMNDYGVFIIDTLWYCFTSFSELKGITVYEICACIPVYQCIRYVCTYELN